MHKIVKVVCGGLLGLMLVASAQAASGGVGFSRNRLIFPAGERAISLTVTNRGTDPQKDVFLVQAGVSRDPSQQQKAPFMVTPPLFRLEANSQNEMRIIPVGAHLPTDRESVFYFSATVIPSTPDRDKPGISQVTFATRTILKLFWRPGTLKMAPQDSPVMMRFVRENGDLVVKNPTPYYQSFSSLEIDGQEQDLNKGPSMVAPFSELRFPGHGAARQVSWQVMNDYGGATVKKVQSVTAG
ncbi:fimbrial biogenesis chaperone [Raoultella ornithinolytica]|uniref:fimbrial biogenesis chaperone n=1 Tax=Raoultella ornithinolytica TaxID=54291 RepID=UPI0021AE475D|nr:molecular chaperone [Raoultella ornithinolytica]MCT4737213.1 molecular chaperone [Raoultella ornithinolytica]